MIKNNEDKNMSDEEMTDKYKEEEQELEEKKRIIKRAEEIMSKKETEWEMEEEVIKILQKLNKIKTNSQSENERKEINSLMKKYKEQEIALKIIGESYGNRNRINKEIKKLMTDGGKHLATDHSECGSNKYIISLTLRTLFLFFSKL